MRVSARTPVVLFLTVIVVSGIALSACAATTGGTAIGNPDAGLAGPGSTAPASNLTALTVPGSTGPTPLNSSRDSSQGSSQDSSQPPPTTGRPTPGPPDSAGPTIPATDLDGEVYGFIRAVDPALSQITLDKVDWFTGAAAQQACAEDGVQGTDNNWCTGYYFRNVNPALRVVAVSPQATIRTLGNSPALITSNLATVAARIATTSSATSTYHLTVSNGEVTDLQEMYRP